MMLRSVCQSLMCGNEILPLIQTRLTSGKTYQKLAGKVAIVTASTDGIGLAIAKRLCEDGAKVMISSRKQKNVDAALEKLRGQNLQVSGIVCHVGRLEDRSRLVEETIKQFGGIDILVSNAGANPSFGPLLDTSEDAWDKIFDTNVKSTFLLCKEVVPHLEKRGEGVIIIVSSIAGYTPLSLIGAYSISKTALLGMTKALAPELAGRNIRVNCVAPGIIKTQFSETLWKSDAASKVTLEKIPLQRLGTPEECASVVSFLASEDAKYMTGETVVVAGGMLSRL